VSRPSFLRQPGNDGVLRPILSVVGAGALVLGFVAAFVPGAAGIVTRTVGTVVGSPVIVVLVTLAGGGYGLFHLYRTGSTESTGNPLVGLDPERAHYGDHTVSGEDIDESVEAVGGELPESEAKDWWTYREKNDVQSALETVSVRVLASEHDVSTAAAEALVASGEWTEDPRAAAFLGSDAPELPLKLQFVDWLSGEAYQRRVEATVDEIARHAGVGGEAEASGRTAADSALPVHETPEAERIAAAADDHADGESTEASGAATSIADVRLDAAVDDGATGGNGTATSGESTAASEESTGSSTDVGAESTVPSTDVGGDDEAAEGEGADAERAVEVAAESGGEDS
jgi:hypothetical protein